MWTRNQKLRGIREKQPGAKGLLKKQIMIFFSKIHCKILSQTFINKEKQVLLCMGLRSNLIRIGLVYIFLTLLEKNLKIQPQLLLRSKSCKTRYILYLGGRWSGFLCPRGQGVHNVPDQDMTRTFAKNFNIHCSMWKKFFFQDFPQPRGLAATSTLADRKIESTNPVRA